MSSSRDGVSANAFYRRGDKNSYIKISEKDALTSASTETTFYPKGNLKNFNVFYNNPAFYINDHLESAPVYGFSLCFEDQASLEAFQKNPVTQKLSVHRPCPIWTKEQFSCYLLLNTKDDVKNFLSEIFRYSGNKIAEDFVRLMNNPNNYAGLSIADYKEIFGKANKTFDIKGTLLFPESIKIEDVTLQHNKSIHQRPADIEDRNIPEQTSRLTI